MQTTKYPGNSKQLLFREMVLGTLVYAVVLGFFNDYTSILSTKSYSVTFLVAVVMQILTYLTLLLKKRVGNWFKSKTHLLSSVGFVVGVWLVLFLSKFIFLSVIDFVFGQAVEISGFVGLMVVILSVTLVKELIDFIFKKLAD
jgi:hypothetical protein